MILRSIFAVALGLFLLTDASAQAVNKTTRSTSKKARKPKAGYYKAAALKSTGAGKKHTKAADGDYYVAPGMAMQQTDYHHMDGPNGKAPIPKRYPIKPKTSTTLARDAQK
jgi:hypothetical protein